MKCTSRLTTVLFSLLFLFGNSNCAWALQSHSAPEGIYSHQIAHILFAGALIYLYWHTRRSPALQSRGWKYLQIFCLLFTLWNLLAFIGHETFAMLSPEDFINRNSWQEQLAGPITFIKIVYCLTKMDHLLYVPAIFALVISLKTFYRDALKEEHQ